ncbi:glycerol-3-phosphate acyltransferase [candidate division WOR-3 bacterium]|nr:glycerol-3-phosphate acyltransferase [candidate division WOR-3 bacterium]
MATLNPAGSPLFSSQILNVLFWTLVGYLSGSLMFSAWLVRLSKSKDILEIDDGNPGASNAFRAGGAWLGIPAILLDSLKGAIPVGLAYWLFGLKAWWLVPVAISPVLGHAFSCFYRFRGGKAAAVSFGVWTGLTLWEGPSFLGAAMLLTMPFMKINLWSVIIAFVLFGGYAIPKSILTSQYHLLAIWAGNFLIIFIKYIPTIKTPIQPRPWLKRLLGRYV